MVRVLYQKFNKVESAAHRPIPRVWEPARAVSVAGSKGLNDPAGNPPCVGASVGNGSSGLSPDPTGSSPGADVDRAAAVAKDEVDLVVVVGSEVVAGGGPAGGDGAAPAGGGPGGETRVAVVVVVLDDEELVVDDAAVDDELMGAGGATGLLGRAPVSFGCALLEEETLLEPKVIVPVEPEINVSKGFKDNAEVKTYSGQRLEDHRLEEQEHQ